MECICESCARKDCKERTKQDDLRIVIACEDYLKHKATNADRIRAMSDEELADFFFESPEIEFGVCEYCKNFGGHASAAPCLTEHGCCEISDKNEAFKKWLQQPAKEEADGPDEV